MTPPRLPRRLLHWFCDPDLLEDLEGDLNELFETRASKNISHAKWMYTVDVLKLFRPGIIKNFNWFNPANNTDMIFNHIKTALRQAAKHKGYTAINIAGLVVGLASCMLILLWVMDELNKDQFHEKADRTYQVWRNMIQDSGAINTTEGIPFPLEHVLRTQYPEIESVSSMSWENEYLFSFNDVSSYEKGRYATPGFFDVFTFPLIVGNEKKFFEDENSMMISDRMALKFFGPEWKEKAIGQIIKIDEKVEIIVNGVFKEPGNDSSIHFDWIIPGKGYIDQHTWVNSWFNGGFRMYFSLKPGADVDAVRERCATEIIRNTDKQSNEPIYLQLYSENYLYGTFENGIPVGGRIQYVRILIAIAILILLIACINFMNLATARSSLRAREIGVRKVMGAFRSTLNQQFFVESGLYAFCSTLLAFIIVYLVLPYFNTLTAKDLSINITDPVTWITLACFVVLTGLLSGVYPAFMLSSFSISRSLKGKTKTGGGTYFRHALVTFQFAISIFLISGTIVISRQLDFILHKDIGLQRDNLIRLDLIGDLIDKREAYMNQLHTIPGVKEVTVTSSNPLSFGSSTSGARWPGKNPNAVIEINMLTVGEDFVKTMGMDILKGEDFTNVYTYDSSRFIINETLAGIIGGDVVGKELSVWGTTGTITGVVKDFHMNSLYNTIPPLIVRYDPTDASFVFVRITDPHETIPALERVTKEFNSAFPFRYTFMDEDFGNTYRSEASVSSLVNIFAGVSIFIACLGLLGLSSFSADQRAKEIGVRKVLGANTGSLVFLLSKQYAQLMIIAFVIAAPLSWLYMQRWLSDFAYRTEANIGLFVVAGAVTFLIGAITVSYKSYSAALMNPVNTLKEE
ncbi:MAG: ABC transporter permease [Bacteroidota bacterium]